MWHTNYEEELAFKRQKVADCLKRIGGIETEVKPVVMADEIVRYRNKVQMPVSQDGIGFYRKNSHDVIDVEDCLLQSEDSRSIVSVIRSWVLKNKIKTYDEKSGSGELRHIYIRSGKSGTLLTLVSGTDKLPHTAELIEMLKKLDVKLAGVVLNVNSKRTNVVLGSKNILLWGSESIKDNIGDAEFEISPNSFYQVNKAQTLRLYSTALRMAELSGKEVLWDLYCGIGTIGQFMASKAKKIAGIEIVPQAIEDAKRNAAGNGIKNAEYFCGAAEDLAPMLIKKGYKPDVVVLDPPRKGCEERLLDTVINSKPERIVYVSCKPSTLARDLKYLSKAYSAEEAVPVDMFPRTSHVETAVKLVRKR